jgi:hypothetical protein
VVLAFAILGSELTQAGREAMHVDPSFPIVPAGPERGAVRRTGGLERARTSPAHLYQAGDMGLITGEKLRQECWETIGEQTRVRLAELVGGVIDWIARRDSSSADGRSYAVVFGDKGLSTAEPRISTEHRPVYSLSAFVFVPDSLRHVQVDHRPPPSAMADTRHGRAAAHSSEVWQTKSRDLLEDK